MKENEALFKVYSPKERVSPWTRKNTGKVPTKKVLISLFLTRTFSANVMMNMLITQMGIHLTP